MSGLHVFREQAHAVITSYAEDANSAGKPHVALSERMMADAALRGEIDEGQTITELVRAALYEGNPA